MAWYPCNVASGGGGGTEVEYIKGTLIPNTYINSSGAAVSYNGWSATDFIEVTAGETINVASSFNSSYNCWYDSGKNKITTFSPELGYNSMTVPTGAAYVRFSESDSKMDHFQVWRDL